MIASLARCVALAMALLTWSAAAAQEVAPEWGAFGAQASASFGIVVRSAGDLNGDGFADVAVSATGFGNGQAREGGVFVWYGSATGLGPIGNPSNAHWRAESDQASGDVDGNGFWFGEAFFGRALGAGDVNGDGYSDLIVGAPFFDSGGLEDNGRVFVYLGSAAGLAMTPAWTASMSYRHSLFGMAVTASSDVNGDGYDDVAVGAPGCSFMLPCFGATPTVYVWYGGAPGGANGPSGLGASGAESNADWMQQGGSNEYDPFGSTIAGGADFNADGFDDLIVGSNTRVLVYTGSSTGPQTGISALPPTSPPPPAWQAVPMGLVVSGASAGDVNDDGFDDLIVGAANTFGGSSRVFVWHGGAVNASNGMAGLGPEGTRENADWQMHLTTPSNPMLGESVAGLGDVNGDGIADVIAGASTFDGPLGAHQGGAFVWYGSATGLRTFATTSSADQTANRVLRGYQAGGRFGFSVAGAGDVNGDGLNDVLVGSWRYTNTHAHEGRVDLFHGLEPPWITRLEGPRIKPFPWELIPACLGFAPLEPDLLAPTGLRWASCPPSPGCTECFTRLDGAQPFDSTRALMLSTLYRDLHVLARPTSAPETISAAVISLRRTLGAAPVGGAYTNSLRDSAMAMLKGGRATRPEGLVSLLRATNALDVASRAKPHQGRVPAGKRARVDAGGIAKVTLHDVARGGTFIARLDANVPASVPGYHTPWPVQSRRLEFRGALARDGIASVSIPLDGLRLDGDPESLRLFEWDGETYHDITTSVDPGGGYIHGRTRRLGTMVVMAPSRPASEAFALPVGVRPSVVSRRN